MTAEIYDEIQELVKDRYDNIFLDEHDEQGRQKYKIYLKIKGREDFRITVRANSDNIIEVLKHLFGVADEN